MPTTSNTVLTNSHVIERKALRSRAHGTSMNDVKLQINGPIGVFDSGAGGISVLSELVRELPGEDFVYYGDSANTPYGEKPLAWVIDRSSTIVDNLLDHDAKAIVIACNTATSAAAETLRTRYPHVPIIGVEPALKPAALAHPGGRILVMATPMTLALDKFQHLADEWGVGCKVECVACEGLAARIERGNLDAPDLRELLEDLIGAYAGTVDCVVLGCTHYPFVADKIRAIMGDVPLFDGAKGTARQTRRLIEEAGLLREDGHRGTLNLQTSSPDPAELDLYRMLLETSPKL